MRAICYLNTPSLVVSNASRCLWVLSAATEVQHQLCVVAPCDWWRFVEGCEVCVKFEVGSHPVGGVDVTVGVVNDGLDRPDCADETAHVGVAQLDEQVDRGFEALAGR